MPRWLKIILCLVAFAAVAVATLPWWAAFAARPVLTRYGIALVNPQPDGFRTLHIEEARMMRGATTVVVRKLVIPSPLLWLSTSRREATAASWSVDVKPASSPAPSGKGIAGMPALHGQLHKIARLLRRWLPRATVGPGEVRWPKGNLALATATWEASVLRGRGVQYLGQTFDLTIDATSDEQLAIQAHQAAQDVSAELRWRDASVTGTATILDQPLQLEATFPAVGWLPETGQARAENWNIPAERAHLAGSYLPLTGHGTLTWTGRGFAASFQAEAAPKPDIQAPPLNARLEARGDLAGLTIESLHVDAPFAQASLTEPLSIAWRGKAAGASANLNLNADLAKQSWLEARGRVTGAITVTREGRQEFSLRVADAAYRGIVVQEATLRGHWDGKQLVIEPLEARLDENSRVHVSGILNWEKREWLNVKYDAVADATAFTRWLPGGISWARASINGTASGPVASPRHAGKIQASRMQTSALKPFDLTGQWRGTGATLEEFATDLQAGKSQLHAAGGVDPTSLTLRELAFSPAGTEQLTLAKPVRVAWAPGWRIEDVQLEGPTGSLALNLTSVPALSFHVAAAHFDKEWLHDWLDLRGPTWRVHKLELSAQAQADTLDFSGSLEGDIQLPDRPVARIELAARGDRAGVELSRLQISEAGTLVTQANGRIAASWAIEGTPHLRVDRDAPLTLQATIDAQSPLWAAVGEPAGIKVAGASAQAQLKGTVTRPEGNFQLRVDKLEVTPESRWQERMPDITELLLIASGERSEIRVDSFQATVEGQAVRARARLPMANGRWQQLLHEPADFNWREIEARLEVPGADLAVLAHHLPALPAARGTLHAEVELARGGQLSGSLTLRDAATRPLPALGVIQDITAEVRFADRTARIESFAGRLGGEPVELQGTIALPPGEPPRPDLQLTGKNLPLVRRAGLLVRTDLDLRARTEGERTRITGLVNLRDCLVLADFSDLFPTGVRGAKRHPPYFSVETEPFNRWFLQVELRGASAVRMRTPFFTGAGSAHFNLTGTLGEPRAIGEVTVEEGRAFFPFATFNVENGAVRLRASDPFNPELSLNAISRRHNYELRLEASGTPQAPVLVFTSNPPLEAGQVLLMVMAGQTPANETTGTPGQGGLQLTQLGAYLGQGIYRGLGGTGENRLEIVSGERVSRQGRETYDVEYKLGERWSLVGEYDEFDSYNAGIKWRVYTQEDRRGKK